MKLILPITLSLILFSSASFSRDLGPRINTEEELKDEVRFLMENFDTAKQDYLIRYFDYANRNAELKGKLLNELALAPRNAEENKRARWISNFINQRIITLKNKNIPKTGRWSYQAGHSNYFPEKHTRTHSLNEVLKAIGPTGVPFEYGYPNFENYRIGEIFKIDKFSGHFQTDYKEALVQIPFKKIKVANRQFSTKEEFIEFLQSNDASVHYSLYERGFEIIPNSVYSIIDYEIPFIDSNVRQ